MTNATLPAYEQVLTSKLFAMPREGDDRGWAGFILGRGDEPPTEPIPLKQSLFDCTGIYVFALTAPPTETEAEVQRFIDAVRKYMDGNFGVSGAFNSRACLWVLDPATPSFGRADQSAFTITRGTSNFTISSNFNDPIGLQVTLSIGQNNFFAVGDDHFRINAIGANLIQFSTNPSNQGPEVTPQEVRLAVQGAYSGCLLLQGRITSNVTLPFFQTGFRYGYLENGNPTFEVFPCFNTQAMPSSFNYVASIDPLDATNLSPTTVDLASGQLRTIIAPVPADEAGVPLHSFWLTASNRGVRLVAQGGGDINVGPAAFAGGLVFTNLDPKAGVAGEVYLTLAGDWGLAVADAPLTGEGAGETFQLLPGLFGLETMSFRAFNQDQAYDLLRFAPNQNAFAPIFPFQQASLNNPSSGAVSQRLDGTVTTAYAWMVDGESGKVQYVARPDSSPLYQTPSAGLQADELPVLEVYQGGTKLHYTGTATLVPMVPYAGLTQTDGKPLGTFESQILSPSRKETIANSVASASLATKASRRQACALLTSGTATTTPQGLLAYINESGVGLDYQKVVLAQTQTANPANGKPGADQLAFVDLEVPLENLFQTNQLFATIINKTHLGTLCNGSIAPEDGKPYFQNTVTISGWTMTAAIGDGVLTTDYRNVMIFKYGDGTVEERVTNPNRWVGIDDFSVVADSGTTELALTGLSQWLQDYIQAGIVEWDVRKNPLYQNFATLVRDSNWNGVLVLRANVDPSGFPDALKGLTAGIDFSTFEAHHFGVNVSRVKIDGSNITIEDLSSSFGLIDYQLPMFRQNIASGGAPDVPLAIENQQPYNFTVLQLQAEFKNAALQTFVSRVQLTANELFGSPVIKTYNHTGLLAANGVVLTGSYQGQSGSGDDSDEATYVFKQETTTIFSIDSNIFNSINFSRVQFNTLTADSGGDDPQILSRFLIWGTLDFTALPMQGETELFDVLSFGEANDAPLENRGKGLAFSNLQVNLASPINTPNAVTYTFEPTGLGFDLAASTTRDNSLFPTFALQIDSFIAEDGDKRPIDYGYLPVQAKTNLKAIDGPWFGVVYKVTMGTPGGLVSSLGFESKMLLAWSPQTLRNQGTYSGFVGLQLPGANPGAKLLSLQGVLKVTVGTIELQYEPVEGQSKRAFNLRLSNIGLTFLGIAKLPPGATINFFLFGDPSGQGALGWYAAYIKDQTMQLQAL